MHDSDELLSHGVFLRRLAHALLSDEHAAADAVQATYLAALNRPAGPSGSPRAWLAAVVRNVARRQRRSEQRRDKRELAAARPEALPSASEAAAQVELQEKIVAAVRALREPYRKTVMLRYYYDRTPTEIARDEDLPVETVKTRLKRALSMLRVSMDRGCDRRMWTAMLAVCFTPREGVAWGAILMTKKTIIAVAVVFAVATGGYLIHDIVVEDIAPRESVRSGGGGASVSSLEPVSGESSRDAPAGDENESGSVESDERAKARASRTRRRAARDAVNRANAEAAKVDQVPTHQGTVTDARGGVVRGAHVVVRSGQQQAVAFSSADGTYRIFEKLDGNARVGFATWPAAENYTARTARGVFEEVERDADGHPALRFRGIAGRIHGMDGKPLAKGFIAARRVEDDAIVAHAPVVGTGWFALFGFEEGGYHLSYKRAVYGWEVRALEGGLNVREWQTDIELKLSAGDTIEGVVLDPAGVPKPKIYLRAYLGKSLTGGYSGDDGRFRMEKLRPGAVYRLMVWAKGYVPEVRDVPAGARDVRFRLDPGMEATGTLLDQNDKPRSVGQLIVRAEDGRDIRWYQSVGGDGRFVLHGLPRGGITVHAIDGGDWWTWRFNAGDRDVVLRPEVAKFDPKKLGDGVSR